MGNPQARQVHQFVQGLDRDDRYIVLLYYADGLTPIEISRVLDLPSTRVRHRLATLQAKLTGLASPDHATPIGYKGLGEAPAAYA